VRDRVTLGVAVWQRKCTIADLRDSWRRVDEGGFDSLWVCDHFLALGALGDDYQVDFYEAWTLLAAMAETTSHVRIGAMVTGNAYRHPGVLAKMAVTVDHLSGGRLEFGIGAGGAGHGPEEHRMLGIELPPDGERIKRLREACILIKKLWTEEVADFKGKYYTLTAAASKPKPVQRPYPPFWIGGVGEKLTLRVVAEQADVWNHSGHGSIDELAAKMAILDEHCRAIGRDPASLRRSVQVRLFREEDLTEVRRKLEDCVRTGFTDLIVVIPAPDAGPRIELAAREILPRFQNMTLPKA